MNDHDFDSLLRDADFDPPEERHGLRESILDAPNVVHAKSRTRQAAWRIAAAAVILISAGIAVVFLQDEESPESESDSERADFVAELALDRQRARARAALELVRFSSTKTTKLTPAPSRIVRLALLEATNRNAVSDEEWRRRWESLVNDYPNTEVAVLSLRELDSLK